MKNTIKAITLALLLTFGASVATAKDGIIVVGRDGGNGGILIGDRTLQSECSTGDGKSAAGIIVVGAAEVMDMMGIIVVGRALGGILIGDRSTTTCTEGGEARQRNGIIVVG